MVCVEDNRTYHCYSTSLSTEDNDLVTTGDLKQPEKELIWSHKGQKLAVGLKASDNDGT